MQSPNTGNNASKRDQIEEQERRNETKEEKEENGSSISVTSNHTTLTDFNLTDKSIEIKGLSSILSSQNKIHKKIQLWTNKYQSEFALRLVVDDATATDQSQNFLAVTDPKADYIRVVAEIDYFGDLKHGWDYTLRRLLEQYKEELHVLSLGKIGHNTNNNSKPNRITIKLIPYIKCHYCNLEFNNEEEEKEHELGYHI
ncbi:MAG TPA: hypothetical protein VE244_09690 [Nitrososphaeraceae archaeon]|jgi:hypothetical protein|nr:hypothetical protein [Nitrososphaeraceae archaeon]